VEFTSNALLPALARRVLKIRKRRLGQFSAAVFA
jgi:hypothetical protein